MPCLCSCTCGLYKLDYGDRDTYLNEKVLVGEDDGDVNVFIIGGVDGVGLFMAVLLGI